VYDKERANGDRAVLSQDDETLLQALANQVAVAIENARQCDDLSATVADLRLRRDQQVQQETLDAVARMADAVASQVRGPLVPIQGLTKRLLEGDVSPTQQRNYLDVILRETQKVERLLTGVTGLADAGQVDTEHREVDALVAEVVERARPTASGQGVSLILNLTACTPAYLDTEKLKWVLGQLIDNAVQALPTGGEVRIATKRCAYPVEGSVVDGICICVRDSGAGIDEDQMDDLFKPFISGRNGGLGLGLASAYLTVRAHGGMLLAHNPPEGGAEFTVFLPDFQLPPGVPQQPTH